MLTKKKVLQVKALLERRSKLQKSLNDYNKLLSDSKLSDEEKNKITKKKNEIFEELQEFYKESELSLEYCRHSY